jgi:hypothetical protein
MKFTWLILFLIIFICLVIFANNVYQPIKEGVDTKSIVTPTKMYKFYNRQPVVLESNLAISFDIYINSAVRDGSWHQVIGVTPDINGSDQRALGMWLCPNTTNLHIRTATTTNGSNMTNGNDNISDCVITLPTGKWLNVCVIGNVNTSTSQWPYTQNWNVYINGNIVTNTNLPRCWFPIATTKVYVMATYNNFEPFDGKLGNMLFVSSDSSITYSMIQQQLLPKVFSGFTNMNIEEGMTGEIAATGKPDPSYIPIKDEDGNAICPQTVLYKDEDNSKAKNLLDSNLNIKSYGVKVPICPQDDMYKIQTVILKQLNDFNAEYANFMTYKYNQKHTGNGDTLPLLSYPSPDTTDAQLSKRYATLQKVTDLATYKTLDKSLTTYNSLVSANAIYYPRTSERKTVVDKTKNIQNKHDAILKLRSDLDNKLYELNNMQHSMYGDSKLLTDSGIYVTILWTTLATSLVYYMFVHM